ncbi:hypothetical protein I552_9950 [Mycobacterium xenopi 3993]|nr:hypothetical protein I552_9950 [Mycobacterium xenopi 3993]
MQPGLTKLGCRSTPGRAVIVCYTAQPQWSPKPPRLASKAVVTTRLEPPGSDPVFSADPGSPNRKQQIDTRRLLRPNGRRRLIGDRRPIGL